jgi:D-sedoheptulose 7-phosphate isomerase
MSKANQDFIKAYLNESIQAQKAVLKHNVAGLEKAGAMVAAGMRKGGKWMIAGNGGSAGDAQHLAAEMTGRLYKMERRGLPAIALTTDSSALTCIGNDYSYEDVFSRQLEALGRKGDVFLGISTSGNSPNVLKALKMARGLGIATIGFSGMGGGKMKPLCDLCLTVEVPMTAHVQEAHIAMGHLLCFLTERELTRSGFIKERAR